MTFPRLTVQRRKKRMALRLNWLVPLGIAVASVVSVGQFMVTNSWPVDVKFRHLIAAANCSTARAVGLAPALRGQPGYHPHLDADRDGISCEPYP